MCIIHMNLITIDYAYIHVYAYTQRVITHAPTLNHTIMHTYMRKLVHTYGT